MVRLVCRQDDLECLRHSSEKEIWNLSSRLTQKEETVRHLEERIAVLTHRTEADCQALGAQLSTDERVRSLIAERALLERRLEEAHIHLAEIKTSWSNKIAILETQVGRLSRQAGEEGAERRNAEKIIINLESKLESLEKEKEQLLKKVDKLIKERDTIAVELKQLSLDTNNSEAKEKAAEVDKFDELMIRLEVLSKENEALKQSNEESRRILHESLAEEIAKNSLSDGEIIKLKEYARVLETALEIEKKVKDQTLLRNAEISQRVQLSEQEVIEQLQQNEELFKKVNDLESQLESSERSLKNLKVEYNAEDGDKNLRIRISELENEITDKNKAIRILQQNLNDVRKTFQTELKNSIETNKTTNNSRPIEEDINFKYMKHVLIKFLTSSEYEAQQLTKAVATLLKLSSEEERLIKETLEWRSSWFGLKPRSKPHFNPS